MMAWSVPNHKAKTLFLEGTKADIVAGDTFGPTTRSLDISLNGVVGLVLANPIQTLEGGLITKAVKRQKLDEHTDSLDMIAEKHGNIALKNFESDKKDLTGLVYKGRPLNGIWATAPYLHNGSVPNLWELLQVPRNRVSNFWVGSRELDPKNVGFVINEGKSEFNVNMPSGRIMEGNSNRGHKYGSGLEDDDKWALIEYMKSL
jgi:hypothetical protein